MATTTSPTHHRPPSSSSAPSTSFDVVKHYRDLIQKDPTLTPPIAAIESLIALLSSNPLTTISETLALIQLQSTILLSSQSNPIPPSAGTELFQRYLIGSFQQRPSSIGSADFNSLRNQLITNSRIFVQRAKQARLKIAHHALPLVKDDITIITYGESRVVSTLLSHAVDVGRYFNLINITTSTNPTQPPTTPSPSTSQPKPTSSTLPLNIPSTTIPLHAATYALLSLPPTTKTAIITGADAVLENGSILSSLGTHTLALLAKSLNIPFYVAVESYKFVRYFPLSYGQAELERMGVRQDLVRFNAGAGGVGSVLSGLSSAGGEGGRTENVGGGKSSGNGDEQMIELTPPELISALVTENGVMTPDAVSEELIKLWF